MRGIRGERVYSWAQEGEEGTYRTTTIEPKLVWTLRCPRNDLQYYRVQIIDPFTRCLIPHRVTLRRQTGSARALVQGKPIEFAIQHNGQASMAGISWGKSKPRAINPLVGSCFRGKPPSPRVMLAMYEHNTLSPALLSSTEGSTIAHERLRTWLRPRQYLCCCNLGFRM
ncbi:hypothetical protein HOY82DRAFT_587430 [Tuber indicum]|nr:hypothetical protein HOY82DRAFT_587430 [Tuber indicum]